MIGRGRRHAATLAARTLVVRVVASDVGGDARIRLWRLLRDRPSPLRWPLGSGGGAGV
jgi:hypothetical protein